MIGLRKQDASETGSTPTEASKEERVQEFCGCAFDPESGVWLELSPTCKRLHRDRTGRVQNPPYLVEKQKQIHGGRRR